MASKIKKFDLKNLVQPIIGVDEVGRGCLAGPVVAAAVILKSDIDIEHYVDSKKILEDKRIELSESIHKNHFVGIGWASVEEIDKHNILQSTFIAMRRAIEKLNIQTGSILVDGRDQIPNLVGFYQQPIIKGDQKVRVISAASIVAKVARDEFMKKLALEFTHYGFQKHKGYGTEFHRQQIQKNGPCIWHRQTFAGVKEHIK